MVSPCVGTTSRGLAGVDAVPLTAAGVSVEQPAAAAARTAPAPNSARLLSLLTRTVRAVVPAPPGLVHLPIDGHEVAVAEGVEHLLAYGVGEGVGGM